MRCFVYCVQLLPAAAVFGAGHSTGLASGQLATSASSGTAASVLSVQSLGTGGTAYILAPTVYTDQELAMLVNR